jgi:hypothetical protein
MEMCVLCYGTSYFVHNTLSWLYGSCLGLLKGKCALGPFLSILVIECQHKCLNVNLCSWMDKVQNQE